MAKVGGLPADAEDPTVEQISAVVGTVKTLGQPPLRLCSFCPLCEAPSEVPEVPVLRFARRRELLGKDGAWPSLFCKLTSFVPGAPNKTLVMTDIISLANLMEWKAMLERLNRQYQGCWGLVAAAEDRGRGVHGQDACQGEARDGPRAPAPLGWDEGC